jgi:hypothetical protein
MWTKSVSILCFLFIITLSMDGTWSLDMDSSPFNGRQEKMALEQGPELDQETSPSNHSFPDPHEACFSGNSSSVWCFGLIGNETSLIESKGGCIQRKDCQALVVASFTGNESIEWSLHVQIPEKRKPEVEGFVINFFMSKTRFEPTFLDPLPDETVIISTVIQPPFIQSFVDFSLKGDNFENAEGRDSYQNGNKSTPGWGSNLYSFSRFTSQTKIVYRNGSNEYLVDLKETQVFPYILLVEIKGEKAFPIGFGSTDSPVPVFMQ